VRVAEYTDGSTACKRRRLITIRTNDKKSTETVAPIGSKDGSNDADGMLEGEIDGGIDGKNDGKLDGKDVGKLEGVIVINFPLEPFMLFDP